MYRRALLLAAAAGFVPSLAMAADHRISGQWQAHLPGNVIIAMDILEDGSWTSESVQNNKLVARMAGTLEHTKTGRKTGTLVFTPVKSQVSEEHGAARVETDKYTLKHHGTELHLVSSGGDVMVFKRQTLAK